MTTPIRESWLGIRDGFIVDESARSQVYRASDGTQGTLAECRIAGKDSAHPGRWMFRLEGSKHWYWETELVPV